MMLVPTYVAPSKIQGLGLFALEPISKGTPMEMPSPVFDIVLTQGQVNGLIPLARAFIARYAWTDDDGLKHIGVDNDKFANHADDPNMGTVDGKSSGLYVALRDIKAGEEITEIYREKGTDYVTAPQES